MRIIQKTEDGSPTIYLPELDEHYHSVHGAIQESSHIFIQAGLRSLPAGHIRILEVGFGTGLNAFLTLLETFNNPDLSIEYFTVERYPLSTDITEQLDYPHLLAPDRADLFAALHRAPWDKPVNITPAFTLHKIEGDIATVPLPDDINLIYFDAFAPEKQPEMWQQPIFDRIACHASPQSVIVTYCAKGDVRRGWQATGFRMEKLAGPPGKRHILRGTKTLPTP